MVDLSERSLGMRYPHIHVHHWQTFGPAEFATAFRQANEICSKLQAIKLLLEAWSESDETTSTNDGEPWLTNSSVLSKSLATIIFGMRDQVDRAAEAIVPLTHEFAAIGNRAVRLGNPYFLSSFHEAVLFAGASAVQVLAIKFRVRMLSSARTSPHDCSSLQQLLFSGDKMPDISELLIDSRLLAKAKKRVAWITVKRLSQIRPKLEMEACRAWKQKYPPGVEFKTLPANAAIMNVPEQRSVVRKRTLLRNIVWLNWADSENLGGAAIRDRWNLMTSAERMKHCPKAPERIGTGDSGRKRVDQALRRMRAMKDFQVVDVVDGK